MNFIKNAFTASAVLLTVAISAPASADTFNLFTNGGDGFVTDIVPNGFHLFGTDAGTGLDTIYTATALSDQSFNVNWVYHTADFGPNYDPAGYVKNGIFTQLTDSDGSVDQNGAFILSVLTNDIYGFYVGSMDGIFGPRRHPRDGQRGFPSPAPCRSPALCNRFGCVGPVRLAQEAKSCCCTRSLINTPD